MLFGAGISGMLCALLAATYPDRTAGCVLYGTSACGTWQPDYPWQETASEFAAYFEHLREGWGTPWYADEVLAWLAPSVADDPSARTW